VGWADDWGNVAEWTGGLATAGAFVFTGWNLALERAARREARDEAALENARALVPQAPSLSNEPRASPQRWTVTTFNEGPWPFFGVQVELAWEFDDDGFAVTYGAAEEEVSAPGSFTRVQLLAPADAPVWTMDSPVLPTVRLLYLDHLLQPWIRLESGILWRADRPLPWAIEGHGDRTRRQRRRDRRRSLPELVQELWGWRSIEGL
jgi:ADP-ribose pyrophosphatase YjhB (NUDIX family)